MVDRHVETTIGISNYTKEELLKLKQTLRESYDDVIVRLLKQSKEAI